MGEVADIWAAAVDYAEAVAGVGEKLGRSVPPERMARMRGALDILRDGDAEAFRAVINEDYATNAAKAVAECLALRAEAELGRLQLPTLGPPIGDDDPTPVTP